MIIETCAHSQIHTFSTGMQHIFFKKTTPRISSIYNLDKVPSGAHIPPTSATATF